MKKLVLIALTAVLTFSFSSCNKEVLTEEELLGTWMGVYYHDEGDYLGYNRYTAYIGSEGNLLWTIGYGTETKGSDEATIAYSGNWVMKGKKITFTVTKVETENVSGAVSLPKVWKGIIYKDKIVLKDYDVELKKIDGKIER